MNSERADMPYLVVKPHGMRFVLDSQTPKVTLGREVESGEQADMPLPDPESLVSRRHCAVERVSDGWVVADLGPATFVRFDNPARPPRRPMRVRGRVPLEEGSVICLPGKDGAPDPPHVEVAFIDPQWTERISRWLIWSVAEERLFEAEGSRHRGPAWKQEIELTVAPHDLIRYMATRNAAIDGKPALCTKDELRKALMVPSQGAGDLIVQRIYDARQIVEDDPKTPQFIITTKAGGYRLENVELQE